jgi:hypothetical protein
VLGPIGSVSGALAFIGDNRQQFDHVILDLDLHGEKSYPVARQLVAIKCPFMFVSGYSRDSIESAYRIYPHCEKPIRADTLLGMRANLDAPKPPRPESPAHRWRPGGQSPAPSG